MAENSKIEWTDHTFNPWTGCTKVSPGCDHCYAESWAKRSGAVRWGVGEPRRRTTEANWRLPLKWNAQPWPMEGSGHRRPRVFCASLADVFDNSVPWQWRTDLFDLIAKTPNLDWLLLTKRIGNVAGMLADADIAVPPNVRIGATMVNQEEWDRDATKLIALGAPNFVSLEPLLGPIDMRGQHPDWVIVGGESGPGARAMHPDWPRSLRDQCAAAGVPFLFKQWGAWLPRGQVPSGDPEKWTRNYFDELGVDSLNYGKKAAGRLLDGVQHDGFPL